MGGLDDEPRRVNRRPARGRGVFGDALAVENAAREMGAISATIAVIDGRFRIGLDSQEIDRLGQLSGGVVKASRRDLALVAARKGSAGTTVAATMFIAELAGIEIFATGGIGGVHRGAEETFDISADLVELSRTRVAVVCAGAKSILDIGKSRVPGDARGRGRRLPHRRVPGLLRPLVRLQARTSLRRASRSRPHDSTSARDRTWRLLIANPIPHDHALEEAAIEARIAEAVAEAKTQGVGKKEATPFLLRRWSNSGGQSPEANVALIKNNAMLAAQAAVELTKL